MSLRKRLPPLVLIGCFASPALQAQHLSAVAADSSVGDGGTGLTEPKASAQSTVSSIISCASNGAELKHCTADTSAGVVMLHPTGDVVCLLGRNWGYDANSVWVSEGCAGEFATGSTTRVTASSSGSVTTASVNAFTPAEAKTITTGINPEIVQEKNYLGFFNPYGSLRTIIGISDGVAQVQDDATRVGIKFSTRGPIKVFAQTEWGVDLVQSETQFNVSAQTDQGFGTLTKVTNPVFTARLGLVGVDLNKWGKLSFGKQNSVHYDITDYTTDRFNVFGGQASATYVAGTDGGVTGTGRADQVVQYHNTFLKILELGAQAQFRGRTHPRR